MNTTDRMRGASANAISNENEAKKPKQFFEKSEY